MDWVDAAGGELRPPSRTAAGKTAARMVATFEKGRPYAYSRCREFNQLDSLKILHSPANPFGGVEQHVGLG